MSGAERIAGSPALEALAARLELTSVPFYRAKTLAAFAASHGHRTDIAASELTSVLVVFGPPGVGTLLLDCSETPDACAAKLGEWLGY